jgi:hypothetical protein
LWWWFTSPAGSAREAVSEKTLLGLVVWDGWDGFDKPVLLQAPAFEIICGCVGVGVNGNFAEK